MTSEFQKKTVPLGGDICCSLLRKLQIFINTSFCMFVLNISTSLSIFIHRLVSMISQIFSPHVSLCLLLTGCGEPAGSRSAAPRVVQVIVSLPAAGCCHPSPSHQLLHCQPPHILPLQVTRPIIRRLVVHLRCCTWHVCVCVCLSQSEVLLEAG